jgi:hypothetical protein
MTPERWRQVTEIFHAALVRDAAARVMYLDLRLFPNGRIAGPDLRRVV